MARIRTIKPEFWTSAQVMACSRDARLFFIGMWNFADDEGKLPLVENSLRAQVFPGDLDVSSTTIRRMIVELSSNELIKVYSVAGREYIWITGWQHQKIDRPRPSKYPDFPLSKFDDHSTSSREASTTDLTLSYPIVALKDGEVSGAGSLAARADGALVHPPMQPLNGAASLPQEVGEKGSKIPVTTELEESMRRRAALALGEEIARPAQATKAELQAMYARRRKGGNGAS